MGPDEVYKEKIGERLTLRLAQALKDGEVTEEELPVISSFILDNIDKAKDNMELITFLEEVAKKWSFFSQILTTEQGEILEKKEDQALAQASSLLKENKIDEAIKVVENATEQTDQALDQKTGGQI